jgi:uncharacterized membrane protein YbhN (UPF0104 family)
MTITVICGFISGLIFLNMYAEKISVINNTYLLAIKLTGIFFVVLFPFVLFYLKLLVKLLVKFKFFKKHIQTFEILASYSRKDLVLVLLFSFSRYIVFVFQFYLLLVLFDADILLHEALIGISLTYFVSSVIPSFTLAELGIRGSAALFFLGMFTNQEIAIIMASSILWLINLAIPAVIGAVVFSGTKI